MAALDWLPDALTDEGVKVYVMPGAAMSGRPDIDVNAVIWHHTATGRTWSDEDVRDLLRHGRPDLKGPLSQLGGRRDGVMDVISLNRCNHNGYGKYGNDSIGIEFYNDGRGEPFTNAQIEAGIRTTAAILRHERLIAANTLGHRESDPTRKIDPLRTVVPMDNIRASVAKRLQPPSQPPVGEDSIVSLVYLYEQKRYIAVMPWGARNLTVEQGYAIDARNPGLQAIQLSNVEWAAIND